MFNGWKKKLSKLSTNPPSTSSSNERQTTNRWSSSGGFPAPSQLSGYVAPPTRRPSGSMNPFTRMGAPSDPPPAYTPNDSSSAPAPLPPVTTAIDDDEYSFLRQFDTIFLIDDSGSMAGSRWRQVEEALKKIAPICAERDEDGVDVWFLNNKKICQSIRTASEIIEIFQSTSPGGGTYTGSRLHQILNPYLRKYERHPETTKPINIIVITDGDSHDDVQTPITTAAQKLDRLDAPPWQVGIQFFQVGNDENARRMLKELDDDLSANSGDANMRDMVDTVPFKGENGGELTHSGILKCVLGAVNRRLDRNSKEIHRPKQGSI